MTKTLTAVSALAIMAAISAHPAHAAVLEIGGGTSGPIPGGSSNNDVLTDLFGVSTLEGIYGGQLSVGSVSPGSTANLLFEFLGYEAGFNNSLVADSSVRFTTPLSKDIASGFTAPLDLFTLNDVGEGLLDFGFGINRTDGVTSVDNGSNPDDSANDVGPNFFLSIVGDPTGVTGQAAYVFLDDGGAGPDDNHDDLVFRVTVSETPSETDIPEPATLALIGMGLIGTGLLARRRLAA